MLDVSPEDFISLFKRRHLTEEFYRDAKQYLGLGKYMARGHEAINRHWWLVFLACNALNRLRRSLVSLARMVTSATRWKRGANPSSGWWGRTLAHRQLYEPQNFSDYFFGDLSDERGEPDRGWRRAIRRTSGSRRR
jgi:hypothetical protein